MKKDLAMKQKIQKASAALVAASLLLFASCSNLFSTIGPDNAASDDKAVITLSADARTVLPVAVAENGTYVLSGALTGTEQTVLDTWKSYTELTAATVAVEAGTYDFTLTGTLNGMTVLTGALTAVKITAGKNALSFAMTPAATGTGTVAVTMYYPKNESVSLVNAMLCELSKYICYCNVEGNQRDSLLTNKQTLTPFDGVGSYTGKKGVSYVNTSIETGSYVLKIEFCDKNGSVAGSCLEMVTVASGCMSSAVREVPSLNTLHSIVYELNGGAWNAGSSVALSYSEEGKTVLPTSKDAVKDGCQLVGWYTDQAFKNKVEENEDCDQYIDGSKYTTEVTLYAKWLSNDSTLKSLTVTKAGSTAPSISFGSEIYEYSIPDGEYTIKAVANDAHAQIVYPQGSVTNNDGSITVTAAAGSIIYIGVLSEYMIDHNSAPFYYKLYVPAAYTTVAEAVTAIQNLNSEGYITLKCTFDDSTNKLADLAAAIKAKSSYDIHLDLGECDGITELAYKDTGSAPFAKCSSLVSIVLPKTITSLGVSGDTAGYAFSKCRRLQSVTLPEGLVTIGKNAFNGCASLKAVTIPGTVTEIEESAFGECTSLADVVFAHGTADLIIEQAAFSEIAAASITIPARVVSISGSFKRSGLQTVSFEPQSKLKSLGHAFIDCEKLSKFTIPASITAIDGAFAGCMNLTDISIESGNTIFTAKDGKVYCNSGKTLVNWPSASGNCTVPSGVTRIGAGCFANCELLSSVTLPDTVAKIGEYAFLNDSLLESIVIPPKVTEIEAGTFFQAELLKSVTLPSQITTIGGQAFSYCSSLTAITIPSGVKTIGERAFSNSGLVEIDFPATVTALGSGVFTECSDLNQITVRGKLTDMGKSMPLVLDCENLSAINLANTEAEVKAANWGAYWNAIGPDKEALVNYGWNYEYTITYVLDGGTNMNVNASGYNSAAGVASFVAPSYDKGAFVGWFADAAFTTPVTSIAPGTKGNVTLYAKWLYSTAGITVSMPTYSDDIGALSYTTNGTVLTFTADSGYRYYKWFLDANTSSSGTASTYTLDTATLESGVHTIMVLVTTGMADTTSANAKELRSATIQITKE